MAESAGTVRNIKLEVHQLERIWSPILANWVLVSALNESRHLSDAHVIWDPVYNVDLYRVGTCDLFCLMWALCYNLYLHYLKCRITVTQSCCQVTTKNCCELKVTWNAAMQLLSNVSCKEHSALHQLLWESTRRRQEGRLNSYPRFWPLSPEVAQDQPVWRDIYFSVLCATVVIPGTGAGASLSFNRSEVQTIFCMTTSYLCIFFPRGCSSQARGGILSWFIHLSRVDDCSSSLTFCMGMLFLLSPRIPAWCMYTHTYVVRPEYVFYSSTQPQSKNFWWYGI